MSWWPVFPAFLVTVVVAFVAFVVGEDRGVRRAIAQISRKDGNEK